MSPQDLEALKGVAESPWQPFADWIADVESHFGFDDFDIDTLGYVDLYAEGLSPQEAYDRLAAAYFASVEGGEP